GTMKPGPYRELGNCPEFNLTRESETLPHFSSQKGLRVKDEEITIEAALNGTVTTDDIRSENVAYFFMGEQKTLTATSETDVSEVFEGVSAGDTYQLGRTDDNPGGHRKITIDSVSDGASPAVSYTEGTDYIVDEELGLLSIPDGSAAIGADITVEYDVAASTREQIIAGEETIEGELKFVSFNAVGPQGDIIIPRARISPNGDFALINDPESTAFQTMPLTISALKKGDM